MTIVRLVSIFPQLDKAGELRSILESNAKATPGMSLSQNIIGELPTFVTSKVFDSLEDWGKDRTDPENISRRSQYGPLVRQPTTLRLLSPIVPSAQPNDASHRYTRQAIFSPTLQGQAAVRSILEEFANEQQADGRPHVRMAEVLFPHEGSAFTVGDSFETLAEIENLRRQNSERRAAIQAKLADNLRSPTIFRIREIIVPANS